MSSLIPKKKLQAHQFGIVSNFIICICQMEPGTNLENERTQYQTLYNKIYRRRMCAWVFFSSFSLFLPIAICFIFISSHCAAFCCVVSKWTCKVFQNALKHLEYEMLKDEDSAEWFDENRFLCLVSIQLLFLFLTLFLCSLLL